MMSKGEILNTIGGKKLEGDAVEKEMDRFTEYVSEGNKRADALAKTIFVLAGGALTISIGIFLRPDAPVLGPEQLHFLKWSWGMLFYSVFAQTLATLLSVWRFHIGSREAALQVVAQRPMWESRTPLRKGTDRTIWFCFTSGVFAFLGGLLLVAVVSISAVPQARSLTSTSKATR
jgi:hypothetical protein